MSNYNLHCGDAVAWLETLYPESVDKAISFHDL
jgi:hypothetical protein